MKTLFLVAFAAGALVYAVSAQNRAAADNSAAVTSDAKNTGKGCAACAQRAPADAVSTRLVPGTNEAVSVGRIENLMPIGVLAALGCETCAGEAVAWALQQGSSTEDVERAIRTIAAMQKLDCFKQQFGPDAAARLDKPLAAARRVLDQAIDHTGNRVPIAPSED